jgi:DNA-binding FrmR family transcriptional regulator
MRQEVAMALCGEDHTKLMHRINRIEGQIRGLRKMVENDKDCFDVLKQIAALNGAIHSLGMVILEDHLKGCVSEAIQGKGKDEELIRQVIDAFKRLSR